MTILVVVRKMKLFFGKDKNKKKELELSNKISKTKSLIKLVHLLTLQKYNLKKWIIDDSICC